jgi:redox-sensitive bicupin YhaK (pirin superfamily)
LRTAGSKLFGIQSWVALMQQDEGPRYIWWNFVSSRKERIEQAKAEWRQARFDSVPGDHEFIPLPQPEPEVVGPKVVSYP